MKSVTTNREPIIDRPVTVLNPHHPGTKILSIDGPGVRRCKAGIISAEIAEFRRNQRNKP